MPLPQPASGAAHAEGDADWYAAALLNPGISRWFDSGGVRLHYIDRPGERPDSPLLLLVHGYRAHARWWDFIAPHFCPTHRVVALDARGMGLSERATTYGTEDFVADLGFLLDHLGTAPIAVVGHSWGGLCVLLACAAQPGRVAHAILVDTFVPMPLEDPLPDAPPIGNVKRYPSEAEATARFRLSPPQPIVNDLVAAHIARASLRVESGGWAWSYDPSLPPLSAQACDGREILPGLQSRVDVIGCERSAVVSSLRVRTTAGLLRQGRGPVMIPLAHHHPMLDQPVALTAVLRALLA